MRKMRKNPSAHNRVSDVRKLHSNSLADMSHLTHIRSLTHTRYTRVFNPSTPLRKLARGLMPTARSSVLNFPHLAICRARKLRRRVLFAIGKSGGNHKKPVYRLSSLVRC